MKPLYAPWREYYATEVAHDPKTPQDKNHCVFCAALQENQDEKNLILGRYNHNMIIMNKYPYNGGHLLVIPFEHVARLDVLSSKAYQEMMELARKSITVLEKELNCSGINIGLNLGKAAGAGIPGHLHTHVLPRWLGDTNFLPVLADTKQVSTDMVKMYRQLKPLFVNL